MGEPSILFGVFGVVCFWGIEAGEEIPLTGSVWTAASSGEEGVVSGAGEACIGEGGWMIGWDSVIAVCVCVGVAGESLVGPVGGAPVWWSWFWEGDSGEVSSPHRGPSWGEELSQSLPMMSVVRISYSLLPPLGLSWLRRGLLVCTGVDGPDMSDGVEQAG